MIKSAPLIVTSIFFASCATLFNSSYTRVDIAVCRPATLVCINTRDTLYGREFTKFVKRGREPFKIVVIADSSRTTIIEQSRHSAAYYANFAYYPWGLVGVAIDLFTPKRFTYPGFIDVDLEPHIPGQKKPKKTIPTAWLHHRNSVKFSPLKFFAFANPGLEVSYERRIGNRFGMQFYLAGIAPPLTVGDNYSLKGIGVGVEPRLYFGHTFRTRWFGGFKSSWSHIKYTGTFNYVPEGDHAVRYPHVTELTTRVDRTIAHLSPRIGFQFSDDRFIGELSFGIGLKYRHVKHVDKVPGTVYYFESRHPNVVPFIEGESDHMTVGTPASFMIGWRF